VTDIMTPAQRSRAMASVRNRDTYIERLVRSALHVRGFRFRNNVNDLPGRPDIVLRRYRTVVFVHGCFWHGHGKCNAAKLPQTRREFWQEKISGNVTRDRKNTNMLRKGGWRVLKVWECSLKYRTPDERHQAIEKLVEAIKC
jgi:DNA mismatch endonuclease (patch repair protein)